MIRLSVVSSISVLLTCCCRFPHPVISSQLSGPSSVTFNDDNGTAVTVDFSDVEFYPVEYFPLATTSRYFTSNNRNETEGLFVPQTAFERLAIKRLINAIDIDLFNETEAGRILSASDLPSFHSLPGHPLYQGTPDYSQSYGISSLGSYNFGIKRFSPLVLDADFGDDSIRHYAVAHFENKVNFGRKIVRFSMWQSMNQGKPRHVWLTDASMWRETSLKPLGRLMTSAGYAILWSL